MANKPVNGHDAMAQHIRGLMSQFKKCSRKGCIRDGVWVPILIIPLIGQDEHEKPVKIGMPLILCEMDKNNCNVSDILTAKGKADVTVGVQKSRRKLPNWDALSFEWRNIKGHTFRPNEKLIVPD